MNIREVIHIMDQLLATVKPQKKQKQAKKNSLDERLDALKALLFDFEVNQGKSFRALFNSNKLSNAQVLASSGKKASRVYVDEKCQQLVSAPESLFAEVTSLYSEIMSF
mmetsp:Transcript_32522/g.49749  ORF Transcript_32522/g.49749 Transcript_32522/m.49749 type:complete len:109 (-) Transcript_32522:627-953(-)